MKDALALALVHFIWQGAVLALAGAVLMRVMKTPAVRYSIGVATLFAMLLAPVITTVAITKAPSGTTFSALIKTDASSPSAQRSAVFEQPPIALNSLNRDGSSSSKGIVIPTTWILNLWTIGVILLSLRFIGGWAMARGLTRQALSPVGEELQAVAADMARRLQVRAVVRVCESASMAVPVMLGCLRPVIILPSAAVSSLPLAQLEALLAHELAHIRRHDYLVNLLQTCVETLCFYHPAAWWISGEVRRHREECCDDVVVEVCDRLTYVTALSSVASFATPQLALSATGGSLRDRVRRLIDPSTTSSSPKGVWIAMLPILLVVALVTPEASAKQAPTPEGPYVECSANISDVAWSAECAGDVAAAPAAAAESVPEAQREVPVEQEVRRAREQAELEKMKQAVAAMLERIKAEQSVAGERGAVELSRLRNEVEAQLERMKVEQGVARERNELNVREIQKEVEARAALRNEEVARAVERMQDARVYEQLREVRPERQRATTNPNEMVALERQLSDLEQALARQRVLAEKGLVTNDLSRRMEQQLAELKEALEQSEIRGEREARISSLGRSEYARGSGVELESSATLQADDRLTIRVEGEPDLPTAFTVRSDGSIRFPFLGSIRVQGSTTSQVQSAIRKLLSDKGLASNPGVTVSAQRRR